MDKISLREGSAWMRVLFALTLFPLLLALLYQETLAYALDHIGARLVVFLILDIVLVAALAIGALRPSIYLGGSWHSRVWWLALLAGAGSLWSIFAMFIYEISLLAPHNLLIRVSVWLGLVVWLGFLLRMGRFTTKFGVVLKFLLVQAIFLVLLEIAVSVVFPQGYSVATIWFNPGRLVPWRGYTGWAGPINSEAMFYSPNEFALLVETNNNGQHDTPVSVEKPANTFRILTIGDSFTWEQEVDLEDTWHVQLERLLSTPQQKVEVVAVGSGGWGTDQALQYFIHDGCRYQPDLVLVQMTFNDVVNNFMPFEQAEVGEIQKPYYELDTNNQLVLRNSPFIYPGVKSALPYRIINTLQVTSRVVLIGTQMLKGSPAPLDQNNTVDGTDPNLVMPFFVTEGDWIEHEKAYALTGAILAEFKRQAENCNTPIAAFMIPRIHPQEDLYTMPEWYQEAFPEWRDYEWHYREPEKRVQALAEAAGIPMLPYERIVVLYDQHYEEYGNLYGFSWKWVGHFTPTGNRQVAEVLADWLQTEGFVQ